MRILSLILILAFITVNLNGQDAYSPLLTDSDIDNRTLNKTLAVGAIPAALDVTPTGAAVYNVPIQVSPGTMGMQPNLSLAYNSQGGRNGLLGYGWNLAGLSSISRVNKTIYHDNVFTNIKNNYDDRFALDGNRLMATVGEYGYPSTIYGTEVEGFARITSYGQLGNGPKWFKVETREGLIMEYGKTPDSRVMDRANNTVIEWKINKTYDKHTNYMEYKYVISNGQHLIYSIDYSGNDTLNHSFPSLGLPYATVQFQYMLRNDQNELFLNEDGKSFKNNNLLKRISLSLDGVVYKKYEMIYGYNFHSYLNEIKEIGLDNTELNSTKFKYQENTISGYQTIITLVDDERLDYFPGDFNGDGLSDIMVAHPSPLDPDDKNYSFYSIYFRTENGYELMTQSTGFPTGWSNVFLNRSGDHLNIQVADFDGDGRDDVLFVISEYKTKTANGPTTGYGDLQSLNIYYSKCYNNSVSFNHQTLVVPPWYMFSIQNENFIKLGDFNGDGATDIFWIAADIINSPPTDPDNTYYDYFYFPKDPNVTTNTPTMYLEGTMHNTQYSIRDIANQGWLYVLDYDGDGKSELMHVWEHEEEQDHTDILEFYPSSNGVGHAVIYAEPYPKMWNEHITISDFNGDGKSDILSFFGGNWDVKVSTGYGFITYSTFTSSIYGSITRTGDFNGDGLNDIIIANSNSNRIQLFANTGQDFTQFPYVSQYVKNKRFFVVENDGDGSSELLCDDYSHDFVWVDFNQAQKHGLLQKISNGLGVVNEIGYQSLSDVNPCYYERENLTNIAIQPIIDFEKPLFVTKWIENEARNGSSSKIRTEYFYEEAKVHTEGKGFMGFKYVRAYNFLDEPSETITLTESEYGIDTQFYFPFVSRSHKSTASKIEVGGCPSYDTEVNLYSNDNILDLVDKGNGRYHNQLLQTIEGFNIKGSTVTTTYYYTEPFSDETGFPSSQVVDNGGVETITTDFDYDQFHTWVSSSLIFKTITVQRGQSQVITRMFKYEYHDQPTSKLYGNLRRTYKVFINNTPNQSSIEYELYNDFGQSLSAKKELPNLQTYRVDQFLYDDRGRFLISKVVNSNGGVDLHQTDYTYNPYWGKVETINKNTVIPSPVSFTYDGFGNKTSETDGFGTTDFIVDWSSSAVGAGGGSNILYFSKSMRANTPEEVNLIDKFGNVRESVVDGYDDKIYHVMEYNAWGKPLSTEGPFYIGATTTPTVIPI